MKSSLITAVLLFSLAYTESMAQTSKLRYPQKHPAGIRQHDHRYNDGRLMPVPPPQRANPKIEVPAEKGRTVMQEQTSSSGSVIATPVAKPKKVVVVPAPPPPGNSMPTNPRKR